MKSFKPSECHALPNQVVQFVVTRTIYNDAANDRGAYGYLRSIPRIRRVSRLVGEGRYLGDASRVNAFVWSNYPEYPEYPEAA
jgi:hypothetical protein